MPAEGWRLLDHAKHQVARHLAQRGVLHRLGAVVLWDILAGQRQLPEDVPRHQDREIDRSPFRGSADDLHRTGLDDVHVLGGIAGQVDRVPSFQVQHARLLFDLLFLGGRQALQ